MNDTTEPAGAPPVEPADKPVTETPPAAQAPETPAAPPPSDVEEGKAFAILSYALSLVGIPFFLVPLIMRNNAFALYHAKQCLILWLAGVAVGVASLVLSLICIGFILGPAAGVALLALCIVGLVKAAQGEAAPLPLIGKWGEEWFKGITKV